MVVTAQQKPDHGMMTRAEGKIERSVALEIAEIGLGPGVEEQTSRVEMTEFDSQMESSIASAIGFVDRRAGLEKGFEHGRLGGGADRAVKGKGLVLVLLFEPIVAVAVVEKEGDEGQVAAGYPQMKYVLLFLREKMAVAQMFYQQADHRNTPQSGREVQRCVSFPVSLVHIQSSFL